MILRAVAYGCCERWAILYTTEIEKGYCGPFLPSPPTVLANYHIDAREHATTINDSTNKGIVPLRRHQECGFTNTIVRRHVYMSRKERLQ